MVNAVVVGQVEVGDAVPPQRGQHRRVGPEHEPLAQRSIYPRGRALKVGHHHVGFRKQRVDRRREQAVRAGMPYQPAHIAPEHHVASEKDGEGMAGRAGSNGRAGRAGSTGSTERAGVKGEPLRLSSLSPLSPPSALSPPSSNKSSCQDCCKQRNNQPSHRLSTRNCRISARCRQAPGR